MEKLTMRLVYRDLGEGADMCLFIDDDPEPVAIVLDEAKMERIIYNANAAFDHP